MSEITVVARYGNEALAAIAQASLAAAGIQSVLVRDDAAGMVPSLSFVQGIGVAVRPEDAAAARAQLDLA